MRDLTMRIFLLNAIALGIFMATSPVLADAGLSCERALQPGAADLRLAAMTKRMDEALNLRLRLSSGQVVSIQIVKPENPDMPTLLMLPGVNRNLLIHEQNATALIAQGFGVVPMGFSTQPFSINEIPAGETPGFLKKAPSLADLAKEIQEVSAFLEKQGIKNIVPVSLSFSGAVSVSLKGFPVVVETSPMTSAAETNPQLEKVRQGLKSAELFNPWFGPSLTRSTLDSAYRKKWEAQVEAISKQFQLTGNKRHMIEGYMAMSRASEGASWSGIATPQETKRVFVLGTNESPSLLRHQLTTYLDLLKKKQGALLVTMSNTGHFIPGEQPVAYASVMNLILTKKVPPSAGVMIVDPVNGEMTLLPAEVAEEYIGKILSALAQP